MEPLPKSQDRFVIEPVELSVKVTARGRGPVTGLATKAAAGGGGRTVVSTLAELFAKLGSEVRAETLTPFVRAPAAIVVTTIVAVALPPFVIVPRLHRTTPLLLVQLPTLLAAETKAAPAGSGSLSRIIRPKAPQYRGAL